MSDFDTEPTTPGCAAPSAAFDRAMSAVVARCTHLTALLDAGDIARVEQVARSAANLWLTGRSALRRLVERDRAASPQVAEARQRLDASYLMLLRVLRRAHTDAPDLSTRSQLDDVRIDLVTAAAKPIDDPVAATDARPADGTQETDIDP